MYFTQPAPDYSAALWVNVSIQKQHVLQDPNISSDSSSGGHTQIVGTVCYLQSSAAKIRYGAKHTMVQAFEIHPTIAAAAVGVCWCGGCFVRVCRGKCCDTHARSGVEYTNWKTVRHGVAAAVAGGELCESWTFFVF